MTPQESRTRILLAKGKLVPLAPIREAFEHLHANGVTQSAIARQLGWWRKPSPRSGHRGRRPDTTRVMRALGARPEQAGHGRGRYITRTHTSPRVAAKLVEALVAVSGLDPVDLGL